MEALELLFLEARTKMDNAFEHYNRHLVKIFAGRVNPQILNEIKIDYYGVLTPLPQLASISIPEPRQLLIKPYDTNHVKAIVGVINSAALRFNAADEGDKVRIVFPEVTTERRRELVKFFGQYTEQAKVAIRGARQDANKAIRALKLSEDEEKIQREEVQQVTDQYIKKITHRALDKEQELMAM